MHASDIEQATKRARAMVMRAGLSKELGPVAYGENEEEVFLVDQLLEHKICQKKLLEKLIRNKKNC